MDEETRSWLAGVFQSLIGCQTHRQSQRHIAL